MERGSSEWMIGVGLVVLGCACAATGLTLMKSSTIHEGEKPFCFRWRWLVGFGFLGILTTVIDVYVLGILPLSVVAPFAGLTIVIALLITGTGCLADAEPVSLSDLVGVALILLGVTLVSVFGPAASHPVTEQEVMDDFQKPGFGLFAGASLLTVTLWVIALVLPEVRARCSRTITAVLPPQAERASALVATALSAYSAAVCGALCQLFVKVVAVTLHEAGGNFAGPHSPCRALPPYLALLGLVCCAPLQLYLLDTALTGSAVSYAVPVYQALLIVLTTAAGGVFFGEFETMGREQRLAFCAGVATAALGLAVLSASGGQAADEVAPLEPESPVKLGARKMRHSYHHPPRGAGHPVERSASFGAPRRALRSPMRVNLVVSNVALGSEVLHTKREVTSSTRARALSEGDGRVAEGDYLSFDKHQRTPPTRERAPTAMV